MKHSISYRGAPERRGGNPNKKKKKVSGFILEKWGFLIAIKHGEIRI